MRDKFTKQIKGGFWACQSGATSIDYTILTALVVGAALSLLALIEPLKSYFPVFPDEFSAKFITIEPAQEEIG